MYLQNTLKPHVHSNIHSQICRPKLNRNTTKMILIALSWKKVAVAYLVEQEAPGGELLRSSPTEWLHESRK